MPKATFLNLAPDKQARIVDAALREFSKTPYLRANLDRIAAKARVSKGSLYQYFSGKLDIYRYLILEVLPARKMQAIQADRQDSPSSVWKRFEQAFLAGVEFSIREPQLTRLGVRFLRDADQSPELAEIASAQRALGHGWVAELLSQGQAQGEVDTSLDLGVATPLVAYALGEGSIDTLATQLGLSRQAYLDEPELAQTLSPDQLQRMIRSVIALLRHGMDSKPSPDHHDTR